MLPASTFTEILTKLFHSTGVYNAYWGNLAMIGVGCLMIYLGIKKKYEPLLLLPIGFGALMVNIPASGLALPPVDNTPGGLLYYLNLGVKWGIYPPLIFLGIGALTDFEPLLSNPKTFLLGGAAQFGIFGTLLGALYLGFSLPEAASIAIIGGADGPTAIFVTSKLSPHLMGAIAVSAYSYMALVPIIPPPIIKALTTKKERQIKMVRSAPVPKRTKIIFPIAVTVVTTMILPSATPLIGMLMLGNLFRESGVVDRLSKTSQNEFINIVTILLGVSVGSAMIAQSFLTLETIKIMVLGIAAFSMGTAAGVLMGKVMCIATKGKINPMIGAAGVSAVPMAARVVNRLGLEENPQNFLLMHAMGPNVAGVIGSAIAAGVLLSVA